MTQKAPIVNESLIQALKTERSETSRSQSKPVVKPRAGGSLALAPVPAPESRESQIGQSFRTAVSPTLTVEVARIPIQGRERVAPAIGSPHLGSKLAVKKAVAGKRRIKQLEVPKSGFFWSAAKLFFGVVMGINVGISLIISGLFFYGAITGNVWKWIPIK